MHQDPAPGTGPSPAEPVRPDVDPKVGDHQLFERVRTFYVDEGLSTREIAGRLGVSRRQVTRALRSEEVPVAPRGAGRPRPATRRPDPEDLGERLRHLYTEQRLTRAEIAHQLGLSEGLIRLRLAEYAIATRSRGRCNREDRREVDQTELAALYRDSGLTADAVGERLGVSHTAVLRAAHDHGLPVRPSAAEPPDSDIELIDALYGDRLVARTLLRHHVPAVPAGGPIWRRFPIPVPLTDRLCVDLYLGCGVSITHIELLTGQPADTVRRHLHAAGVLMRPAGGRCPFRRRWRARQQATGDGNS